MHYVVEVVVRTVTTETQDAIRKLCERVPDAVVFGRPEEPRLLIPVNSDNIGDAERFIRQNLSINNIDVKRYTVYNHDTNTIIETQQ